MFWAVGSLVQIRVLLAFAGGNLTPVRGSRAVFFGWVPSDIGSKTVENLPKISIFSARPVACATAACAMFLTNNEIQNRIGFALSCIKSHRVPR